MSDMHHSMDRLYRAAASGRQATTQSGLARLLNVSPQMVKNWEMRGISKDGALKAQRVFGIDANVLLDRTDGAYFMRQGDGIELHHARESAPATYVNDWPFVTITRDEWDQLQPAERAHIEITARILISAKGPPTNQRRPGPRAATA